MSGWEQGRAVVNRLLRSRRIERVEPNRATADQLITLARSHIQSAITLREDDPAGAFQLAYDAARKSLTAVLAVQGLRPSGAGHHAVLLDVTMAQFEPSRPLLKQFGWMRTLRNDTEYPDSDRPVATVADVDEAVAATHEIIGFAASALDRLSQY